MNAYVEIIRANGHAQIVPLTGDQVTVGSSREAGIAIPDADGLEANHLLLAPRTDGCWVAVAKDAAAGAWIAGKRHENGMVPWGAEIDVGSVTLRVNHAAVDEKRRQARRRRWIIIATLSGALLLGSLILGEDKSRLPRRPASAPELFANLPDICPEPDRERAMARAAEDSRAATAKVVRYPFDAQDGIDSVLLLAVAAECYDDAGMDVEREQARRDRDRIQQQLEEDYRVRRLRLEQVLNHGRLEDALAQTRLVRALLEHTDGAYLHWLIRLERHLEIRLDGKRRKNGK